jgi:O-antigen/teichoic acid export membrane protein
VLKLRSFGVNTWDLLASKHAPDDGGEPLGLWPTIVARFFPIFMQKLLRNSLFSNSIAVLLLRGTTIFTRIAALFVIAKLTNSSEFGMVSVAVAMAEIGKVAADFGTDTLSLKEYAVESDPLKLQNFARSVAQVKTLCCGVIYFALAAYFLISEPWANAAIGLVAALLLITTSASNFSINYFQARLRITEILWPVVANNLVALCLVALSLSLYPSALLGVAILPIAEAVNAVILYRYFQKNLNIQAGQASNKDVLALLKRGLPIGISIIIVAIYTRLDVIVLELFFSKSIVGEYGVAFRCTEPFQLVTSAFAITAYSHLSAILVDRHFTLANQFIRKYGALILSYGVGICVALLLLAPPLIQAFLPQYQNSIPILRVLAVAIIFRTPAASLTCMIQAYGHYRWITYVSVWNLVFIATLLTVLVPRFSSIGAAYSLLIGEIVNVLIQSSLLWYVCKKKLVI